MFNVNAPVNHETGIPSWLLPDAAFGCPGGGCEAPIVRDWAAQQE